MTHGFGSLQDTQAERIDALSLEILQRVGVGVDEALVRSRLAERGARVDEGAGRVYLTEDVLRGLLADAPADVRFGQRTGDTHTVGACAGGTVRWPGNALYLVDG
ncbi:MAG: hypothetical protein QF689_05545, partial [Candidatus Latescibacteria bacterium]|nr:hypothetical protein [Candidatus Latescibacterota bacterium]